MQHHRPEHSRPARIYRLKAALQNLDRALESAQLAVREPLELGEQVRASGGWCGEPLATLVGQAKREPAAIVGVLRAFHEAGANESVDRAADCRSASADGLGYLIERRGFVRRDC